MKRIYFDITDIVEYARAHNHVSGIQRVQIRIIAALARQHGGKQIICSYWNRVTGTYCQVAGDGVFTDSAFNPNELLVKLRSSTSHWLVDKGDVKKALSKYNDRKQYRALKKVELYLTALLWPAGLKRFGIQAPQSFSHIRPLDVHPLPSIPASDVLVFLGANWNTPELLEMGKRHRQAGGQVVQMIYDLIPHTAPQYFTQGLVNAFNLFLDSTAHYVSNFTCISDWTASDLRQFVRHVPGYAPSIRTVPLAHEFAGFTRNQAGIQPTDASVADVAKQRPYVLCVGTVEIRKNGMALLHAWQRLVAELGEHTPQLVFGGKYGWKIDEFKDLLKRDAQLAHYVTVIPGPSDRDLAYLYEHCLFNIYPSFYEGWGLPVGEAAWFGRFSLASSATSLPEVCGDLVDYVDPNDVQEITDKVKHLVMNPEIVKQKEQRILKAPLRDWLTVANDFYDFVMEDNAPISSHAA